MIKPDVIVSWPRSCDYPLWRQFIRENRNRFSQVIIVFTETNIGLNYKDFVREAMTSDHVTFIDSPPIEPDEDWRNVAVNTALLYSNAEWVWFTEQDFFITNPEGFWQWAILGTSYEVIAVKDGDRMHPCSLFMKRELLNKTSKNFGIVPDRLDHFGRIQKDLERMGVEIGYMNTQWYTHMAGLSHNMRLIEEGQEPNHKKDEFDQYVFDCLKVKVPLHTTFAQLITNYIQA